MESDKTEVTIPVPRSAQEFRGLLDDWWRGVIDGSSSAGPLARIKIEIEIGGSQSAGSAAPTAHGATEHKAEDGKNARDAGLSQQVQTRGGPGSDLR